MSKGYVVIAQNSTTDYLRQAYALALSIKATQSEVNNITVATNDDMPAKYRSVFDQIVEIPWSDAASTSEWKVENKWKYYHFTPYDETVILDTDMLFLTDVSHWWKTLSLREVWATTNVRTFRNEPVTSDFYRKVFTKNNLPNIYTAFFYFRKTDMSAELFKMLNIIFDNWERFFYLYLDEERPKFFSADVAYALAIKILGLESECTWDSFREYPSFVHMKSRVQNIKDELLTEEWEKHIPTYYTAQGQLLVNGFLQTLPFHYHRKEWLTDAVIEKLEQRMETTNV
jgi:hypothetical protein